MSLEDSINNLASAIDKLATAFATYATTDATISTEALFKGDLVQPVPMAQTETKRRGRPPGSTNKPKEEPAPTPEPVEEASESEVAAVAPEPEVETTIDDLRKALMALRDHDKGDKSRAVKAMRDISGVEVVPEVPPQFYAAIVAKCKELMA